MSNVQLYLGDCVDWLKTLSDESVDLVVTDPPYGIDFDDGGKPIGGNTRSNKQVIWGKIAGDDSVNGAWLEQTYRVMKTGTAIYVITRWDVEPEWRNLLSEYGFIVKQRLVWHKRVHGKGDLRGTYANTCEDVLFASKGRHILNKRPSMLLDAGCVPTWKHRYHPHQKPISLVDILLDTSSRIGDVVLDPFMGSGATGVACVNTGRNFIGMEIVEEYFRVAKNRIEQAQMQLNLFDGIGSVAQMAME